MLYNMCCRVCTLLSQLLHESAQQSHAHSLFKLFFVFFAFFTFFATAELPAVDDASVVIEASAIPTSSIDGATGFA